MNPKDLMIELQQSRDSNMRRRRQIILASLVGMASMGIVSLLQTGIVKHLPDPAIPEFDSDKVNSSDTAYALGVPDGTLSLMGFAANIPVAAAAGVNRATEKPWIPLAAAIKAGVEAAAALWYFYQMPAKEKAWCAYCITGAAASVTIFALAIPEAKEALRAARQRQQAVHP